jgi:lipoprotein-anchoring transpeptidase ErfK/SrfK
MRRRGLIVLALVVALVGATTVAAYAWDSSKSDEIAPGVRVGEVELGGMRADEARETLRRELVQPLERPVVVTYEGEDYTLRADDLDVRADIDGMVTEALAIGRDDPLPSRIVRYVTGEELDHQIDPEVAYSQVAVARFVDGVAAKVNTEPVNASIDPTSSNLDPVPGKPGRTLRADELRDDIARVLASESAGARTVKAQVDRVEPEVTTEELATQYPDYIVVDRPSFTLRHYEDLRLVKEYTVAIGQQGYDTPAGLYDIQSMQVNPTWYVPEAKWAGDLAGETVPPGPDNPLKARWMGFNGGAGIHGTDDVASLGTAASHGCVRMSVPDVKELYERVDVGTPVYIR